MEQQNAEFCRSRDNHAIARPRKDVRLMVTVHEAIQVLNSYFLLVCGSPLGSTAVSDLLKWIYMFAVATVG